MMNIKNLDDLKNLDKMEALKNMGDGMDAKKHKKQHVCGNLVQCMCGIVMLSIGGVVSFKTLNKLQVQESFDITMNL